MGDVLERIRSCLVDLNRECVLENVEKALNEGYSATKIILGPMSDAMKEIGRLYEEGEYFIAELIEAADIFKDVMKKLDKLLYEEASKKKTSLKRLKIVIGTVKGDVHDIGKTLVSVMLQAAGHEVIDLGVDVDADKFINALREYKADILAMSALLTSTARYMRVVIEKLKEVGLRDKVFVLIGGAATTEEYAKEIGADGWAKDAIEAVNIVNEIAKRR